MSDENYRAWQRAAEAPTVYSEPLGDLCECGHFENVHRRTGACMALDDCESEATLCACNDFVAWGGSGSSRAAKEGE